jgi:hypothetical protein
MPGSLHTYLEDQMQTGTKTYRLTLITDLLGTIAKDPAVYEEFIAARDLRRGGPVEDVQESADSLPEQSEDVGMKERPTAIGKTGFYADDEGILLFDYQVRGFLREAANVLSFQLDKKNLRSKFTNYVFVRPRKLRLYSPDNKLLVQPESVFTRPLRALTAQGPRVSIAQSDVVSAGAYLDVEILVVANRDGIGFVEVEAILDYGELQGLLQFRTGGWGRFSWKSLENHSDHSGFENRPRVPNRSQEHRRKR